MVQTQTLGVLVGAVLLCGCSAILGDPFEVDLKSEPVSAANVQIFTHDSGLTRADAEEMQRTLSAQGLQVKVSTHRDASPPDAAFIGALVSARDARLVLETVPYEIQYLFRPDYPSAEGGSADGTLIGVGYMSTHFQAGRGALSEPVRLEADDLSGLTEPGLSNAEFQRRLRAITDF